MWVYRALGAGTAEAGVSVFIDDWKYEAAAAMLGGALSPRLTGAAITGLGRGTAWTLSTATRAAATSARVSLGWVASTRAAQVTSAAFAGYMIGAVVGTAISQHVWGARGARHAMDFYTGKGKYGEYFDVVTNTDSLLNYYFSGQ